MYTQVMKFGVRSLLEHSDEAHEEMVAAHRYYNRLIDIGNPVRQAYRDTRSKHVPALDAAEQRLTELSAAIDKVSTDIRMERKRISAPSEKGGKAKPTKIQATPEQKLELARLKAERKQVATEAKFMRADYESMLAPARNAFDARTSGAPQELLDAIDEAGKSLKEAKREKNNPDVPRLKARLQDLKARKKKIAPATHKKKTVNAKVLAEMLAEPQWHAAWKTTKAAEARAHDERLKARSECGLTHGTYVAVEMAVDQAFKEADGDPRRQSIAVTGGRKIGRQISGRPMTGADFYAGTDTRLKVVSRGKVPLGREDADKRVPRGHGSARNFREHVIVTFPIGKGDCRKWLSFEAHLSRPVPLDAQITWVYLVPKRVGFRTHYTLQLTVNTERRLVERPAGKGECHVRLRWSRLPLSDQQAAERGIIVAEINGEPFAMDGSEYQARCAKVTPVSERSVGGRKRRGFAERGGAYAGMLQARFLKGKADQYFEGSDDVPELGARRALAQWIARTEPPPWLVELTGPKPATKTSKAKGGIEHWRKHGLLAVVALRWSEEMGNDRVRELWKAWRAYRNESGSDYYTTDRAELNEWLATQGLTTEYERMGIWLEWWRRKDKHLLQWAADAQRKALGNRREQYRIKAAQLAGQFETVQVSALDLSELAKRKTPDDDGDELHQQARYQRFAACPSQLKEALQLAFGPDRYSNAKRERSSNGDNPGTARNDGNQGESRTESLTLGLAAE